MNTDQPNQPSPPEQGPAMARQEALTRLMDLAHDVSSYLRRHTQPWVRVSAALLVAASLAACGGSPAETDETPEVVATAQPLRQEVRTGLPAAPGKYALAPGTLGRDAQGVYHFGWRPADSPNAPPTQASASLMRLAQGEQEELEVPAEGDPILRLKEDTPIPLVASAAALGQSGQQASHMPFWYPFAVGGGLLYRNPVYYDPPRTVATGGEVRGATASAQPRPPEERTVGLTRAVSGRAGGTGSGTAASLKSGAPVTGGKEAAVTTSKSSTFSGGKSSVSSGSSSS